MRRIIVELPADTEPRACAEAEDLDAFFAAAASAGRIVDCCARCDSFCAELSPDLRRTEGGGFTTAFLCSCRRGWLTWYADSRLRDLERRRVTPTNPRAISLSQRARIMERDGFTCRRCGHNRSDGVKLVVDHIVPVARGGTAKDSNLQTLCRDCNAGKAARAPHPHDFIE